MPPITKDWGKEILKHRGITDINKFLYPAADCLQDWHDLDNIDQALDMVLWNRDKKIGIIVDCDVDGYTSAAILTQYLRKNLHCGDIKFYMHEGKQHGLEDKYQEIIDGEKINLLIIPDAGTNDYEYVEKLKEYEIPVVILDHHLLEGEISDNCVVVNNQISPNYHNKDLSGAGVVYQFIRGLDFRLGLSDAPNYIDLAALGVCADMMSALSIENQYLWREGFSHINNYFFQVLCEKQSYSMKNRVNPTTVAFYIVPMINAMIRVGTREEKERLFLAFTDGHYQVPSQKRGAKGTMEEVAVESCRECVNAKSHQDKKKKEVAEALEIKIHKNGLLDNKVLFIRLDDDDDFPAVLNGLVCMQLVAKYKRPTIVARLNDEGYIRGSARGLNQSELSSFKNFLNDSGLFEYTIGHDQAFGISIPNDKLQLFHEYANDALKDFNFNSNIYSVSIERRADADDLGDIIRDLAEYEDVWGQQNDVPLIAVTNIRITQPDIRVMGRNQDTVKFTINGVDCIKFFAKDLIQELSYDEMRINLIGKPVMNEYLGRKTPQLQIQDIEVFNYALDF